MAHAKSKGRKAEGIKLYQPHAVDVSSLRERLSLAQEEFSARFGFSVATLGHWERGDRSPSGASPQSCRGVAVLAMKKPRSPHGTCAVSY